MYAIFIVLGFFLTLIIFPIMLLFWLFKVVIKKSTKKDKSRPFICLTIALAFFVIGAMTTPDDINENETQDIVEETSEIDETAEVSEEEPQEVIEDRSEEPVKKKENNEENKKSFEFKDNLSEDDSLKNAVEAIGMNYLDVKNIDKLDDWASGSRYSFVNNGFRYIVYKLDNGEISSINTDYKRTAIYERGYEPVNYKDFEPDKNIIGEIQNDCLSRMSEYIDGETTLETKDGSMMYDRIYEYYYLYGEVKAKNNIDKKVYTFAADYVVNNGGITCKYISIDGMCVFGEEQTPEIKKTELQSNKETSESDVITLSDGIQGEYGKYDDFDGEQFLRYYIPTGKYLVKCNVRGGFYVETIELHLEDGWHVPTTISQNMLNAGDEIEIVVEDGQCISLIINTEIELEKI